MCTNLNSCTIKSYLRMTKEVESQKPQEWVREEDHQLLIKVLLSAIILASDQLIHQWSSCHSHMAILIQNFYI